MGSQTPATAGPDAAADTPGNTPGNSPGNAGAVALPALPYVRAITPYQPGKPVEELAREFGIAEADIVKLASNENPAGAPESARRAILAAADVGRYPDGSAFALKAVLAQRLDVPADWITIGNGSNDILEMAAAAVLAPGRSCVYAQYSFGAYALATQSRGARAIVVDAIDYGHDLPRMAAAIAPDTRLVYLANPNNPTGTFATPACRPAWSSCSTRPTTNTCRPSCATTPSPGCAATPTCWYRAPSPRPTDWRACAWAMALRSPNWAACSTGCVCPST
jgi:hypothetical protein